MPAASLLKTAFPIVAQYSPQRLERAHEASLASLERLKDEA